MRAPGDRVLKGLTNKNEGLPDPVQGWWLEIRFKCFVIWSRRRQPLHASGVQTLSSYADLATASPHAPWLFSWPRVPLITFSIFNPYSYLQPQ